MRGSKTKFGLLLASVMILSSSSILMTGKARADICALPASALSVEQLRMILERGCPPPTRTGSTGTVGSRQVGVPGQSGVRDQAASPATGGGINVGAGGGGQHNTGGINVGIGSGAGSGNTGGINAGVGTGAASENTGGISVGIGDNSATGNTGGINADIGGGGTGAGSGNDGGINAGVGGSDGINASVGSGGISADVGGLSIGN